MSECEEECASECVSEEATPVMNLRDYKLHHIRTLTHSLTHSLTKKNDADDEHTPTHTTQLHNGVKACTPRG